MRWLCRLCELSSDDIVQNPVQHRGQRCEKCGKDVACYLNYEPHDKRPTPKKSIKHRLKYHVRQIRVPMKVNTKLKKVARNRGCSVHSLIMSYIDTGLNPPLVQTQTGYIPAPAPVRPPAIGLPPSRKKGEKDPLVAEIEKHPMFKRMKERYNKDG